MDKDTKVLLMAVVIILVALVSFNLNDLTGKPTLNVGSASVSGASITVTPGSVSFGWNVEKMPLTVRVDLGSNVADTKMNLYRCNPGEVEQKLGSHSIPKICGGSTCSGSSVRTYYADVGLNDGYYCFIAKKGSNVVAVSNRFIVAHEE